MIRLRPPAPFLKLHNLLTRAVLVKHVGHPVGTLRASNDDEPEWAA